MSTDSITKLKENLSIELKFEETMAYWNESTLTVKLKYKDEVISSDMVYLPKWEREKGGDW